MSTDADLLATVLTFKHEQLLRATDRVEPVPEVVRGLHVSTPALPRVWELNLLLAPEATGELFAACERLQGAAGLRHRKLRLTAAGSIEELPRGWKLDREVVMVRRRAPDRAPTSGAAVSDVGAEEVVRAQDEFLRTEPWGRDPEGRRQLIAQHERWERAAPAARRIGIVERGCAVAWCRLYDDGETTEIDDVSVLPKERGRGLGRVLLEGVLAEVPRERLLFLCAESDDWPQHFYPRLGFDAMGERLGATKAPED